jgi:hypothetical protein
VRVSFRQVFTVTVGVAWLAMMAWLVHREIVPAWNEARLQSQRSGSYEEALAQIQTPRTLRTGIYRGDQRLGQSVTTIYPPKLGDWLIRNQTDVSSDVFGPATKLLGALAKLIPPRLFLNSQASVGPDFRLLSFEVTIKSEAAGRPLTEIQGRAYGDKLHAVLTTPLGQPQTIELPYDARFILSPTFTTSLPVPELYIGRRWTMRILNPLTRTIETGTAEVLRVEPFVWKQELVDTYVVQTRWGGLTLLSWMTRDGHVLKQEAPFGVTLVLEEEQDAPRVASPSQKGEALPQ